MPETVATAESAPSGTSRVSPLLAISSLHGWYGESHVLHGLDVDVYESELVTLLGRNGAGRSSTLKSVMGLIDRRQGSVKVNGVESIGMQPHRIARLGIGYCPEERGIYSTLSVEENLTLLPIVGSGGMTVDEL